MKLITDGGEYDGSTDWLRLTCYRHFLFVRSECRGHGAGSFLFEVALRGWSQSLPMALGTIDSRACRFYERLEPTSTGFQYLSRVGKCERVFTWDCDAVEDLGYAKDERRATKEALVRPFVRGFACVQDFVKMMKR